MIITRPQLPLTGPISRANLQALNDLAIEMEASDLTEEILDAALGDSGLIVRPNFLRNGNFGNAYWQRGTSQVSCPTNTITYRADWWGVKPVLVLSSGVPHPYTVKYEMGGTTGPTASPLSLNSLKLTGDTAVTEVDVLQDIPARTSYALRTIVTLTVWVLNNSGAAFTPALLFDTADALDNFSAVTNRTSTAGTSCGNAVWTLQTFTVDLTAVTNMDRGVRMRLRLPSPALSSGAKTVELKQFFLHRGSTSFPLERDETAEDLEAAAGGVPVNYFENPAFEDHTWLAASVTLLEDIEASGPRGWFARCGGDPGVVLERLYDPSRKSVAAKLTGATGVTTVDFGQLFERGRAAGLDRTMVASFQIYNGTGAAFTPTLLVDTCDAENTFGDTTNRKLQALQECPNASWTTVSHSFDVTGLANFTNGFRLYLQIPSGSLDSGAETVQIAQPQLADGATVPTWTPAPERPEAVLQGQTRGLLITGDGATFDVTVTEAILKDASGRAIVISISSAVTVDHAGANGAAGLDTGAISANTSYYLWLISNGISHSAMLSLSGTAPTMPAGYHYKARVGAIRYTASAFPLLWQCDDVVAIELVAIKTGVGPAAANTWETLDCSGAVPPVAREMWGVMGLTSTATGAIGIATLVGVIRTGQALANLDGNATQSFVGPTLGACVPFHIPASPGATLQWIADATTANKFIGITGYRL